MRLTVLGSCGAWPAAGWLGALSRAAGRQITLAGVPDACWDEVTPAGVDAVWLMGVWERSPAGRALATADPRLQESLRAALPGLQPADVIGSPYAVRRYLADPAFGGPAGLATARAALAARGAALVLDYVPNHVAPDHPWVTRRPDLFVQGRCSSPRPTGTWSGCSSSRASTSVR